MLQQVSECPSFKKKILTQERVTFKNIYFICKEGKGRKH